MLHSDCATSWWVGLSITILWLMLWGSIISMLWLGARAQNAPHPTARTRKRRRQLVRAEEHTRLARQHAVLPPFMRGVPPRSVQEEHHGRTHA
jgi:hypothetical protein